MKPHILQLCPLTSELEQQLHSRFNVHQHFDLSCVPNSLGETASLIRGVVTGGHIGLPAEIGAQLPNLEIVAINGVGFDKVDLDVARSRGYRVCNTPDVLTDDVADMALGLILAQARQIPQADHFVRKVAWTDTQFPLATRVSKRRYGIFGLGRIGMAIAQRLQGFDAEISYCARSKRDVSYRYFSEINALAEHVDVLIIAAAASAQTKHIVGKNTLEALGNTGILINVSRGSLVDETALIEALQLGIIAGAGLDVFEDEPNVPQALIALPNTVLCPHIGSATHETRREMAELVLANLDAHFKGEVLPSALV